MQTSELSEWQRRVSALKNKCDELDDSLAKVQKDYMKSQEQCSKLQRDLRENVAQKEDRSYKYVRNVLFFIEFIALRVHCIIIFVSSLIGLALVTE